MIEDAVIGWDGALCSTRYDRETDTFFVIAIHSRTRGPASGGTRAVHYGSYTDAVKDAMRLSGAMTLKMAAAGLPMGGGKSVIALPAPRHEISDATWKRILAIHADNLVTLRGSYSTGPDVGTTSEDMDVLYAAGGQAFGRSEAAGGPGSSAPCTAQGVYVAIKAAGAEAGIGELGGKRIAIQGLGAVGLDVLDFARKDGAEVVATDVNPKALQMARELGATIVEPDEILDVESDIFSPCAMGGVIDLSVARTIRTRAIAGAANNVLATPAAGDVLSERGIVLAPDFIANSGGAIHLVGREVLGWSADEVASHVDEIGITLAEVFGRARDAGMTTEQAARDLAMSRLSNASV